MPDLETALRDSLSGAAGAYQPARRALPQVRRSPLPPLALAAALVVLVGGAGFGVSRIHGSARPAAIRVVDPATTAATAATPSAEASPTLHGVAKLVGGIVETGPEVAAKNGVPAGERVWFLDDDSQCPSRPGLAYGVETADHQVYEEGGYTCAADPAKPGLHVLNLDPDPDGGEVALLVGPGTATSTQGDVTTYDLGWQDVSLVLADHGALKLTSG